MWMKLMHLSLIGNRCWFAFVFVMPEETREGRSDGPLIPTDGKYRLICTSRTFLLYLKNPKSQVFSGVPTLDVTPVRKTLNRRTARQRRLKNVQHHTTAVFADRVCVPPLSTTLTSVALGLIAPLSFLWATAAWDTTDQQASFKQTNVDQLFCGGVSLFIRSSRTEKLTTKLQRGKFDKINREPRCKEMHRMRKVIRSEQRK